MSDEKRAVERREELDDETFRILCAAMDAAWDELERDFENWEEVEEKIRGLANIVSSLSAERKKEIEEIVKSGEEDGWEICAAELCAVADDVGIVGATRSERRRDEREEPIEGRIKDAIEELKKRLRG